MTSLQSSGMHRKPRLMMQYKRKPLLCDILCLRVCLVFSSSYLISILYGYSVIIHIRILMKLLVLLTTIFTHYHYKFVSCLKLYSVFSCLQKVAHFLEYIISKGFVSVKYFAEIRTNICKTSLSAIKIDYQLKF